METKNSFLIILIVLFMQFSTTAIYADGITIGNGSSLALNDTSMSLGCLKTALLSTWEVPPLCGLGIYTLMLVEFFCPELGLSFIVESFLRVSLNCCC